MKYLFRKLWLTLSMSVIGWAPEALSAIDVKILTFNAWMLELPPILLEYDLAKDMNPRLRAIPQMVAATGADIIAFQEVWSAWRKFYLAAELTKYGYFYSSFGENWNWMGDGLMIVSKHPIASSQAKMRFSTHTRPDERVVPKGGRFVKINLPTGIWIDFYTGHTGAMTYDPDKGTYDEGEWQASRKQLAELGDWIRTTQTSDLVFFAGDINNPYQALESGAYQNRFSSNYLAFTERACKTNAPMVNSFLAANGISVDSPARYTFDTANNSYVSSGSWASSPSETDDYVFHCPNDRIRLLESKIVFDQKFEGPFPQISDHFGVLSTYRVFNGR